MLKIKRFKGDIDIILDPHFPATRHSPVQVVEEAEEVERQLDPALPLAGVERVRVHDGGGVIQPRPRHHRPPHVPANRDNSLTFYNSP